MGWLGLDILSALSAGELSTKNLAVALGASDRAVCYACAALAKKDLIVSSKPAKGIMVHKLTKSGGVALAQGRSIKSGPVRGNVRRPDSLRARAWRAMRIKRKFSVPELCGMLCDGTATDPEDNLEQYVLPLMQAGYLAALPCAADGTPRYLLVKDTGLLAPSWNKQRRCLSDPNTGEQITLEALCTRRRGGNCLRKL